MMEVEQRMGGTLEDILPDMLNEYGLVYTASVLVVDKATLAYWLKAKLGIQIRRVALRPGETIKIERTV